MCAMRLSCYEAKLPNLKLKTRPKQLLGSLSIDIAHPAKRLMAFIAGETTTKGYKRQKSLNNCHSLASAQNRQLNH
jgi:hypothetical protein